MRWLAVVAVAFAAAAPVLAADGGSTPTEGGGAAADGGVAAWVPADGGAPDAGTRPDGGRAPAPKRATDAELRKRCYGGPGKALTDLAAHERRTRGQRALLERQPARARDEFRKVLQGGPADPGILRAYGQALLGTGEPRDAERATACSQLLERLPTGR